MAKPCSRLAVRRATLPYFRPWVVVDLDTNKIVAHCKSEAEAKRQLERMEVGIQLAQPMQSSRRETCSRPRTTG